MYEFARETGAVLEAAAVGVGAFVGGWGDEGVEEIAAGFMVSLKFCPLIAKDLLCIVDLNHVEPAGNSPLDRSNKSLLHVFNIIYRHLLWERQLLAIRNCTGCICIVRPAIDLFGGDGSRAQPLAHFGVSVPI